MSVQPRDRNDAALVVLGVVALVWIGALLGVSFLATPVKFLAPSLSLPVALDVGRQTFRWFSRFETLLAFSILITALAYETRRRRAVRGEAGRPYALLLAGFLLVAVGVQGSWLLPLLDARVEVILQGGTPPPSYLHDVYIVIEASKLGALVGLAWLAVAALRDATRHAASGEPAT